MRRSRRTGQPRKFDRVWLASPPSRLGSRVRVHDDEGLELVILPRGLVELPFDVHEGDQLRLRVIPVIEPIKPPTGEFHTFVVPRKRTAALLIVYRPQKIPIPAFLMRRAAVTCLGLNNHQDEAERLAARWFPKIR